MKDLHQQLALPRSHLSLLQCHGLPDLLTKVQMFDTFVSCDVASPW